MNNGDTARALILRTCDAEMRAYDAFVWPSAGLCEAPDWSPEPVCGGGLHGLLWGEGDGDLLDWSATARWLVCEVEAGQVVDLGGKVKVPRAWVVHAGDRLSATAYLAEHGGQGRAIVGGTATAGDRGTASAGYGGTATAGYRGTATAGYRGTAIAGDRGTAVAGYRGTATAGDYGTATAGDYGTATAGYRGTIAVWWWDASAQRSRLCVGYVGEAGIEAGVPYRVVGGCLVRRTP